MTRKPYIAIALAAPALLIFMQTSSPAAGDSGGDITGKVFYTGAAPTPKTLKMDADPYCAQQHPQPVLSKDVVLNPDKTLQNVLVYVKAGLPAAMTTAPPTTPVKVDQKGCIYTPRVVVVMVNQPIEFTNSDDTNHHIQAMAEINKNWTVSQNKGTPPQTTTFDKPEIGMLIICHLHPWMRMFVHVLTNPYYSITAADGTFRIKGLPAGYYTLEAWHEKFGTVSMKVQAGAKADFTFKDE